MIFKNVEGDLMKNSNEVVDRKNSQETMKYLLGLLEAKGSFKEVRTHFDFLVNQFNHMTRSNYLIWKELTRNEISKRNPPPCKSVNLLIKHEPRFKVLAEYFAAIDRELVELEKPIMSNEIQCARLVSQFNKQLEMGGYNE